MNLRPLWRRRLPISSVVWRARRVPSSPDGENPGCFTDVTITPCANTPKRMPTVRQPMQRVDRFKVCLDPACDSWLPLCPACGADMVQRRGPYGQFWDVKISAQKRWLLPTYGKGTFLTGAARRKRHIGAGGGFLADRISLSRLTSTRL